VIPVPGYGISTPYGKRGSYWGCKPDAYGNGIHTGADFAAPAGTKVVAARGGKAVYCNHGSSFGYHQIEILPGDGTRDFYAHMPSRAVSDGAQVTAGQQIGKVGAEGNVTGPHLHFERHTVATGGWSCGVVTNPQPSIDYQPASGGGGASGQDEEMPKFSRTKLTKPVTCPAGEWVTLTWDHVSSGDAGTAGAAYLLIGPSPYTATLLATVNATGEIVRTRFLERSKDDSGAWVTADSYPNVEHPLTSGATYLADTRTQNVAKGDRLTVQVNFPSGGVVESAELNCLYF
jgi:murein DD-endopeptidase MepM/ murein hydrolase activator NlpD